LDLIFGSGRLIDDIGIERVHGIDSIIRYDEYADIARTRTGIFF